MLPRLVVPDILREELDCEIVLRTGCGNKELEFIQGAQNYENI